MKDNSVCTVAHLAMASVLGLGGCTSGFKDAVALASTELITVSRCWQGSLGGDAPSLLQAESSLMGPLISR